MDIIDLITFILFIFYGINIINWIDYFDTKNSLDIPRVKRLDYLEENKEFRFATFILITIWMGVFVCIKINQYYGSF